MTALLVASPTVLDAAPAVPDDRGRGRDAPLVIGHRGASGYRPEHTLGSYRLAADLGADFIEPDLVSTGDGVLVARHENEISGTTDVADRREFADRRTAKSIDGVELTGWFTEDFALAELKTLRAVERLPDVRPYNTVFDGLEQIPTLQEVIDLAREQGVGICLETKHSSYFDSIGLSLEEPLIDMLEANGYDQRKDRVFIQSFETANLRKLDGMTRLRLVQLIGDSGAPFDLAAAGDDRTYDDLVTPEALTQIAGYADGIGPDKGRIIPRDGEGRLQGPTTLVDDAHHRGLIVHPYTFRNEHAFLPADLRPSEAAGPVHLGGTGGAQAEYRLFFALGVDGVISDHPDTAVAVRG